MSLTNQAQNRNLFFQKGLYMYEKLIKKANQCFEKALKTKDVELKIFYLSASKGYEDKAKNLTIEEAC